MAARIVATQLAVWSFPAAERLRARGKLRIQSKRMQEAVGIQRTQIQAIGFHSNLPWTVAKTYLLQRKRQRLPRNLLAAKRFAVFRGRVANGVLRQRGRGFREQCRSASDSCGGQERPAGNRNGGNHGSPRLAVHAPMRAIV
jgi:hypothetical protein